MTHRVHCFNAGPAQLPLPVLQEVQQELLDFNGSGMSVMELSHRSPEYAAVHAETQALFAELLGLGNEWKVLFLPGGSSQQFFSLPMNLLGGGKKADYVSTGTWSKKAIKEAKRFGDIHLAHDAANAEGKFTYIPTQDQLDMRSDAVYLHITTNNTIAGTQWQTLPRPPEGVWLAADMCSDMLWRKFDPSPFGIFYASAQKNLGPAGVTLVAIRQELLDLCGDVPTMVSYKTQVDKDSLFNTGPTFPIYVVGKVLKWIKGLGGLEAMEARNRRKAGFLYGAFDARPDYWSAPVRPDSRSLMNVVWRIKGGDEELEKKFIAQAKAAGLVGLKGHRSVGGLRASIYNAMEPAGVQALVDFMEEFSRANP